NQCDVVLLAGNHDAKIKRLRADLRDSFATDRFEFHHGDCEREQNGRIQIIGHFHPAATLHDGAGLRLKFPALVQQSGCWILPAFSPWAPGTEWIEREQGRIWLCTPNRILLVDREGLRGGGLAAPRAMANIAALPPNLTSSKGLLDPPTRARPRLDHSCNADNALP